MLLNNLDAEVAERPEELVVYGGSGKAARNHEALRAIVAASSSSVPDETSSSRAASRSACHDARGRSARADRELAARPKWATWDEFRRLEAEGLTMFGQMTAGSWIYIAHRGSCRGRTRRSPPREKHFGSPTCAGGRSSPPGSAAWEARSRSPGRWPARRSSASRSIRTRIERGSRRATSTRRPESLDDALDRVALGRRRAAAALGRLLGNAADVVPELVARGEEFDS
jgi:urocanate hydratase